MKEEQLFEAIGQIDTRTVAEAQRRRGRADTRGRKEYIAAPEKSGGIGRWLIPAVCALAAAALVALIPHFYRGGDPKPLLSITATDTTGEHVREEDPTWEPERIEWIGYKLAFSSAEEYWQLREAVDLPDEALSSFLWDHNHYQGEDGIGTRDRLMKFLEDTRYLPIPSLPGDTLKLIVVKEYESAAFFEFSGFTMEIKREPDKALAERETRQLSRIPDHEGYPLYMGSEEVVCGVAHLNLYMIVEDHLVTISAETDDPNGFIHELEQLSFQFPEIASVTPPVGEYGGTMDGFAWKFVEQTGTLTFTPLRENARVGGYMLHTEAPWYAHAEKITAVIVEDGILGLEPRCITELPNLQKVSLPESLVSIGDEVFAGCAIETLQIPASVTDIGVGVAADCQKLRKVAVDAWQPRIGRLFLYNCTALETITLKSSTGYWQQVVLPANPHLLEGNVECALDGGYDPAALYDENGLLWSYQLETGSLSIQGSGVAALPPAGILMVWEQVRSVTVSEGITAMEGGLADMVNLRYVSLPATLETLPPLSGCKNLETVTVPKRIKELPSMAFHGCAKLKTVVLPEGLEKIENMAFGSCGALEYVSIPDSVSWIDQAAFWACLSLKEIRLPESLRRLKEGTFMECVQLHTVTLPAGLADIESHCFEGCTALKTIRFTGTQAQWDKLYSHCADAIPEGVSVEVDVQPAEETKPQEKSRFSLLWIGIPMVILAVIVTEIVIGKRKKTS